GVERSGGDNGSYGRLSELHAFSELLGILAVRNHHGVSCEADWEAGGQRAPEARVPDRANLPCAFPFALGEWIALTRPVDGCIGEERRHIKHLPIGGFEESNRFVIQ